MHLLGVLVVRIVETCTALDVEPVRDLVLKACGELVPALDILAVHAVHSPIRVVVGQIDAVAYGLWPILVIALKRRVPSFVNLDVSEVLAPREKVEGSERVVVRSGRHHVLVILQDIVRAHVKEELVIEE